MLAVPERVVPYNPPEALEPLPPSIDLIPLVGTEVEK